MSVAVIVQQPPVGAYRTTKIEHCRRDISSITKEIFNGIRGTGQRVYHGALSAFQWTQEHTSRAACFVTHQLGRGWHHLQVGVHRVAACARFHLSQLGQTIRYYSAAAAQTAHQFYLRHPTACHIGGGMALTLVILLIAQQLWQNSAPRVVVVKPKAPRSSTMVAAPAVVLPQAVAAAPLVATTGLPARP